MTKIAQINVRDEAFAVISGLEKTHLDYFYEKYGIRAPNYFFNPLYKMGRWDGKIRYFQSTGTTYAYLLEEIVPILIKYGYEVKLNDQRNPNIIRPEPITETFLSYANHMDSGQPLMMRDYQVEAVNVLLEAGNGICIAGTGAGKTLTCAALVKAYDSHGVRSLTIVPDTTLIKQTKSEYVNIGLDTGEYSGDEKTLDHQHVVSTWQALKNNPAVVSTFQMVIVDECHGLKGNVLTKLLTEHAHQMVYRFGFTGTLPKEESDRMAVHVAVGPVRFSKPANELIAEGMLSDLQINVYQLEEDLRKQYDQYIEEECTTAPPTYTQFKDSYFPDFATEKSYLQRKQARIEWIAQLLMLYSDDKKGNVLCLVDSIPFGRRLAECIPNAIFVNGQDVKSPAKRKEVYDMFKDRDDLVVIATVHIAGTGLSINRIFNLVFVDVGKSFIRVIQAIGRGLRKASDKDSVLVTDICSDLKYGKKHFRERVKYYDEAGYPHKKIKVSYEHVNI